MSTTYTTAHSNNARSLTHWLRPEIKPETSWFLAGLISAMPRQELLLVVFWLLSHQTYKLTWAVWILKWVNSRYRLIELDHSFHLNHQENYIFRTLFPQQVHVFKHLLCTRHSGAWRYGDEQDRCSCLHRADGCADSSMPVLVCTLAEFPVYMSEL